MAEQTQTGTGKSIGVFRTWGFQKELEEWVNETFPGQMGKVQTALLMAGFDQPDKQERVKKYILTQTPSQNVAKAKNAIVKLTPEERKALIEQLTAAEEEENEEEPEKEGA